MREPRRRCGLVQGMRAAGPAAKPPTRAQPVCFDAVETACGPMPAPCRRTAAGENGAERHGNDGRGVRLLKKGGFF